MCYSSCSRHQLAPPLNFKSSKDRKTLLSLITPAAQPTFRYRLWEQYDSKYLPWLQVSPQQTFSRFHLFSCKFLNVLLKKDYYDLATYCVGEKQVALSCRGCISRGTELGLVLSQLDSRLLEAPWLLSLCAFLFWGKAHTHMLFHSCLHIYVILFPLKGFFQGVCLCAWMYASLGIGENPLSIAFDARVSCLLWNSKWGRWGDGTVALPCLKLEETTTS